MIYYDGRFTNYTVVVTGAANGIGRSCAERFAQEGANTVICDIDRQNLKKTEDKIVKKGQKVQSFVFDIGKKNEVDRAMKETLDRYKKIEVLVHCAGVANEKRFIDLTEEDWLRTININLNGSFYILQPIVRNMVENRFGKIINITSKSGLIGRANRTPYSASKFGQNGLTQALALEVAPYNVNVNAICPSRIESQMTIGIFKDRAKLTKKPYEVIRNEYIKSVPIGRLGLPEDVAAMAAFLATEEASYITGQFISVSGGR